MAQARQVQKDEAGKEHIAYVCRLKPGHPTGLYRRGGFVFQVNAPTMIPEKEMTDEIRNDAWVIIEDE